LSMEMLITYCPYSIDILIINILSLLYGNIDHILPLLYGNTDYIFFLP